MMLAPRPRSTAADLLRVLAFWLAAIVGGQAFAAAHALGLGPWHRHLPAAAARGEPHHHHDGAERHHHHAGEAAATAWPDAGGDDPAFDAAALALVAAFALMAVAVARVPAVARNRLWQHVPGPAWRSAHIALPRKRPRRD